MRRMDDLETEKKIAVEMEEEDRIYTVDTIHRDDPPEEDKVSIQKLYKRLEALEAGRESMRRAIVSMRTDKAQLFLLKEIAQNLYQEKAMSKSRSECSGDAPRRRTTEMHHGDAPRRYTTEMHHGDAQEKKHNDG